MCRRLFTRLNAGYFPVALLLLTTACLVLTYCVATLRHDVDPLFPYISDAGSKRPESCIFGQMVNITAFLTFIIMYLRYRLVKELNRGADIRLYRVNIAAFVIGCISSFGMTLVANFQETAVLVVHLIGALTCFGGGMVYSVLQTWLTYRMYPLYNGIFVFRLRAVLCLIGFIVFVTSLTTGALAVAIYHHQPLKEPPALFDAVYRIKRGDEGYWLHVTSAVCEWTLTLMLVFFMMTYTQDFEKLRVTIAVEPLVAHLDESPARAPSPEARRLLNAP